MVELRIQLPNGSQGVWKDTAENLVDNAATRAQILLALDTSFNLYNRSMSAWVNGQSVYVSRPPGSGYQFSSQSNLGNSMPWDQFLLAADGVVTTGGGSGGTGGTGGTGGGTGGSKVIYRLGVQEASGGISTGATYPGCSQSNTPVCQPLVFSSVSAWVNYSYLHGEVPYVVDSDSQVWATVQALMAGTVDASRVLAPGTTAIGGGFLGLSTSELVVAGLAAYFLFLRK